MIVADSHERYSTRAQFEFRGLLTPQQPWPAEQLALFGWGPRTQIWKSSIDVGEVLGRRWAGYRVEFLLTRMPETEEEVYVPLRGRVQHQNVCVSAWLEARWVGPARVSPVVVWGDPVSDVELLTADQVRVLWRAKEFLTGSGLAMLMNAVARSAGGRPTGAKVWPLEVFEPVFIQAWRHLRTELKRSPTDVEMHAAMPRLHGQPPLALATFRRRWHRSFPGKRWKDLSF